MAEFASVIALASLNGATGFRIDGVKAGDLSGFSVAAGDFNGDGFDDLIVGAYAADPNFQYSAGTSYVLFGKGAPFASAINLSTLNGTTGFRLDGAIAGDHSGFSVASAGDINGDNFEDLLVGALGADIAGKNAGSSYVVFGKAGVSPSAIALSSLDGANGFRLDGVTPYDYSGRSVSSAGDVNGDGFDDLIIGADFAGPSGSRLGTSYVIFGKNTSFGSAVSLSTLDGTTGFKLVGSKAYDYSGHSVSAAGDVNGDGFGDVIIGAHLADPGGRSSEGTSYVAFGKAGCFSSTIALASLSGASGFRIEGNVLTQGEQSGFSVRSAGDVNGDRFDDLIIGAPRADRHGFSSGSAYVVFGKAASFGTGINVSSLNGANGFRLDGIDALDYAGIAVDSAGDMNGDGFDDIIIGAYFDGRSGTQAGTSYVVFGKVGGFGSAIDLAGLNGVNGFRLDGVAPYDYSGRAVASAGDVNGDGFGDIVVGAYQPFPAGTRSGSSYVIFGRAPDKAVNRIGSTADQHILGGAFNDTLSGLGGVDTLDGGAGNDLMDGELMRGGIGNDIYVVDSPADKVVEAFNAGLDTVRASITYALAANVEGLVLTGTAVAGTGNGLNNTLTGNAAGNRLDGGIGNDRLTGGPGLDVLIGGPGNDIFDFNAPAESPSGAQRDRINDFNPGTPTAFVDRIDLSTMDADDIQPGNQAFAFIGTAAFTINAPAKARYENIAGVTLVSLNTDNDATPEMQIQLTGTLTLDKSDFIL